MKWRSGPRPWAINLFAILLLASSLYSFVANLLALDEFVEIVQYDLPSIAWTQDLAIVWLSALFSIVLFPLVWIWGLGSRVARIVVTVLTLPAWLYLIAHIWIIVTRSVIDIAGLIDNLVVVTAISLLFTPSASQWIAMNENETCPETIE